MKTAKEVARGIHYDACKCYDRHGEVPEGIIDCWEQDIIEYEKEHSIDNETLGKINKMCQLILGNCFGNLELDTLAFYVGHHPNIIGKE